MKRFFTFAVALCALLFAACEPESATTLDSKLTRTSAAIMEFNAAGGAGEITYTLENPANGVQVIAHCEASWIDGLTSSDNKVTFTVDANTTGQSRLTTIAVTYGSNCKFEVTVSQSATGGNTGGDDDGNDDGGSNDDDYYYAYSNLTEDYSFNIAGGNAYGYIDFYGDYYEVGVNNFYLDLYEDIENGQGLNIFIDLLASTSATNFVGTYTPYYTSDSDSYTFIEGYSDEEGYLLGSWIATLTDGEISEGPLAPITLGSVTIATTNEANVYTVTLDCEDDLGYKISGTYKGELEYGDMSEESSVAPKKANKKGVNITKKAVRKMSKKLHIARR